MTPPVSLTSSATGASRAAWLVVCLLIPVALLNYLDRQMLASMKTSVMADVPGIHTEADWGWMLARFKWVYAFFSPLGGYIADRFGRRATICGSLLAWSAVTWTTGHVHTAEGLLVTRSLMGISEAFYFPAALALITDYHAGSTKSRAIGFHQMGVYAGVIAGGFSGHVADAEGLGWRFAFDLCGLAGMLYAVPLYFLLREAPVTREESAGRQAGSVFTTLRELLSNGSFLLLVICFTLPGLAGWVVRDWMPAILKDQFSLRQGGAGVWATLPWQVAAIPGAVLGGWLADRWMRRTHRGRLYVSALGMALIIPAIFGVGNAGTLGVAVAALVLFGLGWGFFDCNNMPILSQITRPGLRATGYGLMNFAGISAGGLADWGFGVLRDRQLPLNLIFTVFALLIVIPVILVLLIRPRREEE